MKKTIFFVFILVLNMCSESTSYKQNSDEVNKEFAINDSNSHHQDPTDSLKILFIGNSLTFYNNMPGMFEALSNGAGKKVIVETATIGGLALRHLINRSIIIEKIQSDAWDYIILQSDDISAFPDMYNIEIATLRRFKNIINSNYSNTKMIYLMVWGLRNGVNIQELNGEMVYYSYLDYINKIYDGTLYIADEMKMVISPVGWAWKNVRQEYPNIELLHL